MPRWAAQELLGGEVHEPVRPCGYCGDRATARYISRDESRLVVWMDLCGAERCHESLLDDLRAAEVVD